MLNMRYIGAFETQREAVLAYNREAVKRNLPTLVIAAAVKRNLPAESSNVISEDDSPDCLPTHVQEAVNPPPSFEAARKRAEEELARLLAEATEAAAKVMVEAEKKSREVEKQRREVEESCVALEEEKAAMEKAHTFQKCKI
jgi:hypothetical protein